MKTSIAFRQKSGAIRCLTRYEEETIHRFVKNHGLAYTCPFGLGGYVYDLTETEKAKAGWKDSLSQIADSLFKDRFGNQPLRFLSPEEYKAITEDAKNDWAQRTPYSADTVKNIVDIFNP